MNSHTQQWKLPSFFLLGLLAAAYLFRMAYLPVYAGLLGGALLLFAFRHLMQLHYGITVPFFLLSLLWVGAALDSLGNLFKLYERKFSYFQYDEFTHTAVPFLLMPAGVWVLREYLRRSGFSLPLFLIVVFTLTTLFTLSGGYEILELWDDKYMHPDPGWRIHGPYDTPNDLQCDLLGLLLGAVASYYWLRKDTPQAAPATMPDGTV